MYPENVNYVMDSFNDATSKSYGYLMLDLHQLTPEDFRLRTNILPGERQISCKTYIAERKFKFHTFSVTMSKRMREHMLPSSSSTL